MNKIRINVNGKEFVYTDEEGTPQQTKVIKQYITDSHGYLCNIILSCGHSYTIPNIDKPFKYCPYCGAEITNEK